MFPPWFTFHITSAVNGAFRVAKQNRLRILLYQQCCRVWSESLMIWTRVNIRCSCHYFLKVRETNPWGKKCLVFEYFSFSWSVFKPTTVPLLYRWMQGSVCQEGWCLHLTMSAVIQEQSVQSVIFLNILLPCLKQLQCTHCNVSFKTPSLQMDIYPCRCELTDRCFGRFREAVSQFSVKVTVHHTNPH